MALKWIIGDFRNGAISEANELPVVYNESDKVEIDINANESATITVSKNDLPSDWRTYLRPVDRFVALIETDLAWASSVIWAGFINKASARVNETVQIQATGLREYMAARIVSDKYNTTNTNPESAVVFQSANHRGLMANIISSCFSSSGIPSSSPKPPQVLSYVNGSVSGSTVKHSVLLSDFESYGSLIDVWRDELSDSGQEYRFKPSWSSSSKTAIRWIGEVATPTAPHFNEANTLDIVLGDNEWRPISYGQSASSDNMVSRIIGQSKEGENTAGADYQTRTITLANSILLDESWNPGVELTDDQMFQNLNARLVYNSQSFKEADFSRAYETTAELRTIISQLGSMATFSGSGASQYFGLTMRIVGVSFNPSKKTVELQLAPKAARYPKLPKDNRGLKKKSQTKNTGRRKRGVNGLPGEYGDYTNPITKQPYPGYNGSNPIPGGVISPGSDFEEAVKDIANPIPDKPFQPPIYNNPRDAYADEAPIFEVVDMRSFKNVHQKGSMTWSELNISQFGHDYPDLTRSRFNYSTGKLIGINKSAIGGDLRDTEQPPKLGYYDIDVFEIDAVGMFNRDDNPYMNEEFSTSPSNPADDFKLKVGSISYGMYSDLYIDPSTLEATIPPAESGGVGKKYSQTSRAWDFSFFCSADHQVVYVQILYTVGKWQIDKNSVIADMKKSYSMTTSKVFKGVRNNEGKVEQWEDLGDALSDDSNEYPWVFFSPNIYDINGEFKAFGGYYIPQQEDGILIFDGLLPDYSLKFYGQGITSINHSLSNFSFNSTDINLPDVNRKIQTESGTELINDVNLPFAVNVDYSTQKVVLGISKGQNNRSSFFEADFSNLTSYKKIMDTNREDVYPYIGYDTGSDRNSDGQPDNYPPVDPFALTSRAPVKYKNNYIQFNPEGINITLQPSTPQNYNNKKIKWLRTKSSFSDVVKGELEFNRFSYAYNSTTNTFKYAYPLHNTAVSNGNLLNAFRGYIGYYAHITQSYVKNRTSTDNLPKPYGGFEYFYLNGFLYVFCDVGLNKQDYLSSWDNGREGRANLSSRYWIGKFKFKDDILGN